jgi:hypothetical protein
MPIAEEDTPAFPTLGFLIDGETCTETSDPQVAVARLVGSL